MRTIFIIAAAVALCAALSACGHTVQIQRVEVPIPVPCVDRSKIPGKPVDRFSETAAATMDEQVRALLLDREADRAYAPKLRALVESCVLPVESVLPAPNR